VALVRAAPARARLVPFSSLVPIACLVGALAIGAVLIALSGASVGDALGAFWEGVGGSGTAFAGSVLRAVPLALVGLGFLLADRAGLTNVGGEGQIAIGGMVSTAACLDWGASYLPGPLAWLYPLVLGAIGGAVWGAIAGVLRARRGSNEVITTLLLTFIALEMVYGAVQSEHLLRQPATDASTLPESLEIPGATMLPRFATQLGLPLHLGVVLEVLAALGVFVVLQKSVFGLTLRAVGLNPVASRRAGLPVDALTVGALAASGALGGLAGAIMIQGGQHYLTSGFSSGFGFDGLVVGLLARGSALQVLAFALLFGCLRSGGLAMEMMAQVPSAVVVICQGLIVVSTAAAAALVYRRTA
jgi:simple sugar transport system permease protein